uniref:Odorant receptor n=1 Tax=Yemma signatus TaxID=300820 RepID=A0A385H5S6_9HEMI|nr:odorant receptor [Yemma signatus]
MDDTVDPLEETMVRSGFVNRLSIIVALRGPLQIRFDGTWRKYPYLAYTWWVEFVCFVNLVTVGIQFLMPGIDVVERCFTGFPFFSLSLGFFRVLYTFLRRERFATLMEGYDSLYRGSPELEADVARYARVIKTIPLVLILLTAAPMAPWCFMPMINTMLGGEWSLSVPSFWPFDPFRDLPTYIIVIVLQSFAAGYTCLRVILFDNIFYVYACRQLALTRHLKRELARILKPTGLDKTGLPYYRDAAWKRGGKEEVSAAITKELRTWVVNHQRSYSLGKELEALYSPSLLYQYTMISITLCTNAFVVVYGETDFLNVFLCFLYIIGNSMELLITCAIGDFITNESSELEKGTLGSHVYLLDKSIYKFWVKMILIRARVPLKISALGIYPLNSRTFKDIMVTAYSFFTLLKSMKARN